MWVLWTPPKLQKCYKCYTVYIYIYIYIIFLYIHICVEDMIVLNTSSFFWQRQKNHISVSLKWVEFFIWHELYHCSLPQAANNVSARRCLVQQKQTVHQSLGHLSSVLHEENSDIPDKCHEIKLIRRRLAEGQEPLNMLNRCYIKDVILGDLRKCPNYWLPRNWWYVLNNQQWLLQIVGLPLPDANVNMKSHGMHVKKWQAISGLICGCLFYEFSHFKKTEFFFGVRCNCQGLHTSSPNPWWRKVGHCVTHRLVCHLRGSDLAWSGWTWNVNSFRECIYPLNIIR